MAEVDPLQAAILVGAVTALGRRAAFRVRIAADASTRGSGNLVIRQGESAVALRIAQALHKLADELEREERGHV